MLLYAGGSGKHHHECNSYVNSVAGGFGSKEHYRQQENVLPSNVFEPPLDPMLSMESVFSNYKPNGVQPTNLHQEWVRFIIKPRNRLGFFLVNVLCCFVSE